MTHAADIIFRAAMPNERVWLPIGRPPPGRWPAAWRLPPRPGQAARLCQLARGISPGPNAAPGSLGGRRSRRKNTQVLCRHAPPVLPSASQSHSDTGPSWRPVALIALLPATPLPLPARSPCDPAPSPEGTQPAPPGHGAAAHSSTGLGAPTVVSQQPESPMAAHSARRPAAGAIAAA